MSNAKFEAYATDAQKTFTEHSQQFSERMEEVAVFAKGNMDAMIASAAKATESMKDIATEMLGFTKMAMDTNLNAIRELSQIKDASEFVEKQTALAKGTMEGFAKQAQKLNEMSMAAAKECAEPVNARLAAVGEMVKAGAYRA